MHFPFLKKFLILSVLTVFCACGKAPVIHSQDTSSTETSPIAQPAALPSEPLTQMIDDFEGDPNDLTNNLGGESGEWNLNPEDINDSYTDPLIAKMPGKDGTESQV